MRSVHFVVGQKLYTLIIRALNLEFIGRPKEVISQDLPITHELAVDSLLLH